MGSSLPSHRTIWLNLTDNCNAVQAPELQKKTNRIRTSQYTFWSFPFMNLYKQFHRAANVYFLVIMLLQTWQEVSITRGDPSMATPLAFVLLVTAIKDALEDWSRRKYDRIENNRPVEVLEHLEQSTGEMRFVRKTWSSLKVGSIVRINNRDMVPADIALLQCANETSRAVFVMTAGLDGETNLKQRQVPSEIPSDLRALGASCKVTCNHPNKILDSFDGTIAYEQDNVGVQIPLDQSNILLRGSQLRNSAWALGVVVYAGGETKLQMNAANAHYKTSSAMLLAQRLMMYIFAAQCTMCLGAAIMSGVHAQSIEGYHYLWLTPKHFAEEMSLRFFNYVIIFTNFIPISLLVTIDMVKFCQGFFISWDLGMYHPESGRAAKVNCSELNEEIGSVEHVFSDKTGTLTANIMKFRACASLTSKFRVPKDMSEHGSEGSNEVTKVATSETQAASSRLVAKDPVEAVALRQLFFALSLNHSVLPETLESGQMAYSASSPDEGALVQACEENGMRLKARGPKSLTIEFHPSPDMGTARSLLNPSQVTDVEIKILHVLEFTSDRKRSSVIFKDPETDEIKLFCKGADNVVMDRLTKTSQGSAGASHVFESLDAFASEGLRTLCIAKRVIPRSDYEKWNARMAEAAVSVTDRLKRIEGLQEEIEVDLELVGCTGIEDKLQEEVPETISALREAGIKVWMLTGDKVDTAINIGFSCALWTHKMDLLYFLLERMSYESLSAERVRLCLEDLERQINERPPPSQLYCLVLDTKAVYALDTFKLMPSFLKIANRCESVICARVSPDQKATIVQGVRDSDSMIKTLSIGDGANDVPMIQRAHVGIGIYGQEGLQAANAADFSIARFKYLRRLLFVHGRWSARRVGILVCYMFYKNAVLVLPQFFYAFACLASGQAIYLDYPLYQGYNLIYTAFPIIVFGVLDKDINHDLSFRNPRLYLGGSLRSQYAEFFSKRIFWRWMLESFVHASLIVLGVFALIASASESASSADGKTHGIWYTGATTHLCVCLVVTLRLFLVNKSVSWLMIAAYVISFVFWFGTLAMWSETRLLPDMLSSINNAVGVLKMLQDGAIWATVFCTTVIAILPSYVSQCYTELFAPTEADLTRRRQILASRHEKPGTVHPNAPQM